MSFITNILSSLQSKDGSGSSVVGIDVGSASMKVVELEERKGVVTLVTYGEVQLGPYAGKQLGDSVTLDAKQEQEALVDVIRESAVKARNAVFAMPLSSSFVTNVSIDADADADLSSMVRVEARKVIPASLSEVTLDWAEVEVTKKEAENHETDRRNVLIAAIQNSALERFKVLMQFVGIQNPPTEIECFSSIRSLYSSDESDFAIIDIGATSAKLYITRKGLLMRMYRIRAGGAIATKKISETLNINFETAEELKYIADKQASNFTDMKRAHNSSYDRAFREFNQVLREYEQRTGVKISTVYLSGGGALFPGIDAHLKDALSREVILSNPFARVAYPAFMEDTMKEIGPSFTVAVGAALRSFE
ncbi:type IV pilus assembly protein PilM [Candidatus Kaiserbacteria bacterium]|nr:type IV pilus assembly protein PilM [Candidatus Kaiserbacteria bacterium]USN88409.1 MAG: type IV pilus assembly protein PilM [Candidatus Nomurabacteria bacterium]